MKLKFIEEPKKDIWASKETFSDVLKKGEMNSLIGGDSCAGVLDITCGPNGKNSCRPFDCTIGNKNDCSKKFKWVSGSTLPGCAVKA